MREIKFRAWDKDDKVMRSWEDLILEKDKGDDFYTIGHHTSPAVIDYFNEHVLMQYTGLKDKNGMEIYEGDVVSRYYKVGQTVYDPHGLGVVDYLVEKEGLYIGVVNYRPSAGFILNSCRHYENGGNHLGNLSGIKIYPQFSKVIGNIYENPELLEVE